MNGPEIVSMNTIQNPQQIDTTDRTAMIKAGTRWADPDGNMFHVISVFDATDGHTWVYYEQDGINESRTFSCWTDSFIWRFTPVTNQERK